SLHSTMTAALVIFAPLRAGSCGHDAACQRPSSWLSHRAGWARALAQCRETTAVGWRAMRSQAGQILRLDGSRTGPSWPKPLPRWAQRRHKAVAVGTLILSRNALFARQLARRRGRDSNPRWSLIPILA